MWTGICTKPSSEPTTVASGTVQTLCSLVALGVVRSPLWLCVHLTITGQLLRNSDVWVLPSEILLQLVRGGVQVLAFFKAPQLIMNV